MNVYTMAINNVASAIRTQKTDADKEPDLNAFVASQVLAAAFCKSKKEVLTDLLRAPLA